MVDYIKKSKFGTEYAIISENESKSEPDKIIYKLLAVIRTDNLVDVALFLDETKRKLNNDQIFAYPRLG
jgi:hypothetical protein